MNNHQESNRKNNMLIYQVLRIRRTTFYVGYSFRYTSIDGQNQQNCHPTNLILRVLNKRSSRAKPTPRVVVSFLVAEIMNIRKELQHILVVCIREVLIIH